MLLWLLPFVVVALVFLGALLRAYLEGFSERQQSNSKVAPARAYLAAFPGEPLAYERLADVLVEVGELDEALAIYQEGWRISNGRVTAFSGDLQAKIRLAEGARNRAQQPPTIRPTPHWEPIWIVGLLTALGLGTFQLVGDQNWNTPLSAALAAQNSLAWFTIAMLAGVITSLARRLWQQKHRFRTAVLLLNLPALAIIGLTDMTSAWHNGAFFGSVLLTTLWLLIVFLDAGELWSMMAIGGGILVGGLLFPWSNGVSERLIISILVVGACWHHSAHLTSGSLLT